MREKKRIRRKNMGYKKLILFIIIIFILILLLTKVIFPATVSFSRYVYSAVKSFYLNSKEFYFTSNRLAKNVKDAHFESNNWSGLSDYKIEVEMYSRKNTLKKVVSTMDITYKIRVDVGIYKYGKDSNNKVDYKELEYFENVTEDGVSSNYINVDVEKLSGIIYASSNNTDDFFVNISSKDNAGFSDNDYVYIYVVADAVEPYTDTLCGEFYIYVGKEGLSYQIDDSANSPYLNVVLTNATEEYTVDQAFGGYSVGDIIKAETYNDLVKAKPAIKEYCHSKYVDLTFNPNEIVLDTTSNSYIIANNKSDINWLQTEEIAKDTSAYTYFNKIRVEVDALESQVIKFYKLNVQNNYTYPNESNTSIVTVESV